MKPQTTFNSLPMAARWAIVGFGIAGLAAAAFALGSEPGFSPSRLLILLALAAGSARAKVTLYRGASLSFLTSVVLLAVISQGPAAGVLVSVFGVTVQAFLPKRKLVFHQAVFNAGMISMTVVMTWWIYKALTGLLPLTAISSETAATVVASFTYFLGNSISVSFMVGLSKGLSMLHVWTQHFMYSAPSFLIAGILSLGLMSCAGSASIFVIAVVLSVVALPYYCSVRSLRLTA